MKLNSVKNIYKMLEFNTNSTFVIFLLTIYVKETQRLDKMI